MATVDSTTGLSSPVSMLDELAILADSYESFQLLAMAEDGHSSPVPIVLAQLNLRFRALVDGLGSAGLLS